MRRSGVLLASTLLFLVSSPALAAETMYARTSARVRADRTLSAAVVARLEQGDAVTVLGRSGRHYRVVFAGRGGWVYYNTRAEEKPEDIASLLAAGPATAGMELTELAAGGALRGLSPATQSYARGANVPHWAIQAVEQMQSLRIAPQELDAFAREGGLGEYGEGR